MNTLGYTWIPEIHPAPFSATAQLRQQLHADSIGESNMWMVNRLRMEIRSGGGSLASSRSYLDKHQWIKIEKDAYGRVYMQRGMLSIRMKCNISVWYFNFLFFFTLSEGYRHMLWTRMSSRGFWPEPTALLEGSFSLLPPPNTLEVSVNP